MTFAIIRRVHHLSILEAPVAEAKKYPHPQEDYLLAVPPHVFVVADGITLNTKLLLERGEQYPNPSPSYQVAKLFCEGVVEAVEKKFDTFDETSLREVFKEANKKVAVYNEQVGRSEIAGNKTGWYGATGAFVVIKENRVHWASICDSGVARLQRGGALTLVSKSAWSSTIINGEENMAEYLEQGSFDVGEGDKVFVLTDGFLPYLALKSFSDLFNVWDETLSERISVFSKEMIAKDPVICGDERSLIALLF